MLRPSLYGASAPVHHRGRHDLGALPPRSFARESVRQTSKRARQIQPMDFGNRLPGGYGDRAGTDPVLAGGGWSTLHKGRRGALLRQSTQSENAALTQVRE